MYTFFQLLFVKKVPLTFLSFNFLQIYWMWSSIQTMVLLKRAKLKEEVKAAGKKDQ